MRATARTDGRRLRLGMKLLGADAVGPHARRVDDVVGAYLELGPGLGVARTDPGGAVILVQKPGDLEPVRADRPEPFGLAQDREHEPGVVCLTVVEQIPPGRLARGEGGQQLDDLLTFDEPVARGAPVCLAVAFGRGRRPALAARAAA